MNFKHLTLVLLLFCTQFVQAQILDSLETTASRVAHYLLYRDHDSSYVGNYGNHLSMRILAMNKSNYFALRDFKSSSSIRYKPAGDLYLGVGFAYKWIAADISLGLGLNNRDPLARTFDFQGRAFTSKHYLAATLQYYQKYKYQRALGTKAQVPKHEKERHDLRTSTLEISYLYTVNYTHFSLKAPFILNELQRKSAGSFLVGANFNMFNLYADSSIIPTTLQPEFVPDANLTSLNLMSLSFNFGYMYTLVLKEHFFVTASLIPGLHYNMGDFSTGNLSQINGNVNLKLNSMNAIGYNGNKFYGGVYYLYNGQLNRVREGLHAEFGHGKVAGFIGYRFGLNKKK